MQRLPERAERDFDAMVDEALAFQANAARRGDSVRPEAVLDQFETLKGHDEAELALIYNDYRLCRAEERPLRHRELVGRFPSHADALSRQIEFGHIVDSCISQTSGEQASLTYPIAGGADELAELIESAGTHQLIGRFQIIRLIGHGGMGSVFLARDTTMDRDVAIKIPRAVLNQAEDSRDRFFREARMAARLEHPNLIDILEVGTWGEGFFLVTRFADQGDLASWLQSNPGPYPAPQAVALLQTIANAVASCHQNGILHLDLKPGNILFTSPPAEEQDADSPFPGMVKVADFGLARLSDVDVVVGETGSMIGTPMYMAPEQLECRRGDIGKSTDVFALGILLRQVLTGRHPFESESSMRTLENIREVRATPLPKSLGVPNEVKHICQRCLSADISERYPSAKELADDLRHYSEGKPLTHYRPSRLRHMWRWAQRGERISQAAVAAIAGNVSILIGFLMATVVFAMPNSPFNVDVQEFVEDALVLAFCPHLPCLIVAWWVLRGHLAWQWANVILAGVTVALVFSVFLTGESPVRAYNTEPFAFLMSHLIVLSVALSVFVAQVLAVPAVLKWHRDQRESPH